MNYLENISPNYLDILSPLSEWKILSVEEIKKFSEYAGKPSSFYKAIAKLEKEELIKSFIDSFTNQKFVYLHEKGIKALGLEKQMPVHEENRFHDAHLVRALLDLKRLSCLEKIILDHKIKEEFPLLPHIPDAVIVGRRKEKFNLAIELELTQKAKDRLLDRFSFYDSSPYFNNVLYLFNRRTTFETYKEVLENIGNLKNKSKFLFLYEPMLTRKNYDLLKSETHFKNRSTTLQEVFLV